MLLKWTRGIFRKIFRTKAKYTKERQNMIFYNPAFGVFGTIADAKFIVSPSESEGLKMPWENPENRLPRPERQFDKICRFYDVDVVRLSSDGILQGAGKYNAIARASKIYTESDWVSLGLYSEIMQFLGK